MSHEFDKIGAKLIFVALPTVSEQETAVQKEDDYEQSKI